MSILKIGFILLAFTGLGFGVDRLSSQEIDPTSEDVYRASNRLFCHNNQYYFEHMIDNLTEEEKILVEQEMERLLGEYNITYDLLHDDIEVYHSIMIDLMDFFIENDISYSNHHWNYRYEEDENYNGGMGMH